MAELKVKKTLNVNRESLNVIKETTEHSIKTFEDLDVWKACQQLRKKVTGLSRKFPKERRNLSLKNLF